MKSKARMVTAKERVHVETYSTYTLAEFQEKINEALEDVPEECRGSVRLELELEEDPGYYSSTSYPRLYLKYARPENMQELNERVSAEIKHKAALEAREKAEFERLSKKFK